MAEQTYRVVAYGVMGTEFQYDEIKAESGSAAVEKAYGEHGRRLRDGEVTEALGSKSSYVVQGETVRTVDPDHCPTCRHDWGYHAEDGCQAPVQINGSAYDCNCMRRG